jgi:hypothetical protein
MCPGSLCPPHRCAGCPGNPKEAVTLQLLLAGERAQGKRDSENCTLSLATERGGNTFVFAKQTFHESLPMRARTLALRWRRTPCCSCCTLHCQQLEYSCLHGTSRKAAGPHTATAGETDKHLAFPSPTDCPLRGSEQKSKW